MLIDDNRLEDYWISPFRYSLLSDGVIIRSKSQCPVPFFTLRTPYWAAVGSLSSGLPLPIGRRLKRGREHKSSRSLVAGLTGYQAVYINLNKKHFIKLLSRPKMTKFVNDQRGGANKRYLMLGVLWGLPCHEILSRMYYTIVYPRWSVVSCHSLATGSWVVGGMGWGADQKGLQAFLFISASIHPIPSSSAGCMDFKIKLEIKWSNNAKLSYQNLCLKFYK